MSRLSKQAVAAGLREAARLKAGFVPGETELAGAPLLSHWVVEPVSGGLVRLFGEVSGHPLLPDGWCTTSAVLAADEAAGWVRTASRYYRLGPKLSQALQ